MPKRVNPGCTAGRWWSDRPYDDDLVAVGVLEAQLGIGQPIGVGGVERDLVAAGAPPNKSEGYVRPTVAGSVADRDYRAAIAGLHAERAAALGHENFVADL